MRCVNFTNKSTRKGLSVGYELRTTKDTESPSVMQNQHELTSGLQLTLKTVLAQPATKCLILVSLDNISLLQRFSHVIIPHEILCNIRNPRTV